MGISFTSHKKVQCIECGRQFNLLDDTDSDEWFSGHDCEVTATNIEEVNKLC